MAAEEEWRKNAETQEIKRTGVEGSKRPPGEVLHQRRNLPFSITTMAITGFVVTGIIGYLTLYAKKKPEATARDVAKVSANLASPQDTHPTK